MRRLARVVILFFGAVFTVVGAVAAVVVGPDSTVQTGEREFSTDGVALTTSPTMLDVMGPTLHVAAAAQDGRELFVGVGHQVDVDDYLDGVAHDQIAEIKLPASFEITPIDGAVTGVATPPATRDWWYVQSAGRDRQQIVYELGREPVNVVIMTADGQPPVVVDAEFGLQVDNLFTTALLVLAAGLVLLGVGIFGLRRRRRRAGKAARLTDDADRDWSEERQL